MSLRLEELNGTDRETFVARLGAVFEHSPWVAAEAWETRPFGGASELHAAMMAVVLGASDERLLALIRAHPDLATRLGIASLTEYSAREQQGAGLDRLTPAEFETFSALNEAYREKFGWPFIFAVRGFGKTDILAAMSSRLGNRPQEERREALAQIGRITALRLRDLLGE